MLQKIDIRKAFTFLESGPVTLVTTNDGYKDNVMTISWHMVMDFTPHIAISTGPWNHSFDTILKTKECVICVPGADLAETAIGIGNVSGKEMDKFAKFHLTKGKSAEVKAPLIEDCLGCIECQLIDYVEEHHLLIFKGIHVWENPDRSEQRTFHANGDGTFVIDGNLINLRDKMRKWVPAGCERF